MALCCHVVNSWPANSCTHRRTDGPTDGRFYAILCALLSSLWRSIYLAEVCFVQGGWNWRQVSMWRHNAQIRQIWHRRRLARSRDKFSTNQEVVVASAARQAVSPLQQTHWRDGTVAGSLSTEVRGCVDREEDRDDRTHQSESSAYSHHQPSQCRRVPASVYSGCS